MSGDQMRRWAQGLGGVSPAGAALWALLAWRVRPGERVRVQIKGLARETGWSRNTIKRALGELQEHGALVLVEGFATFPEGGSIFDPSGRSRVPEGSEIDPGGGSETDHKGVRN